MECQSYAGEITFWEGVLIGANGLCLAWAVNSWCGAHIAAYTNPITGTVAGVIDAACIALATAEWIASVC